MEQVFNSIPGILAGISACIPLAIQLVKVIQNLVKERQWSKLMKYLVELMQVSEEKLSDGKDKKEWVLAMVKASTDEIGYAYDEKVVGDMIDSLVAMAKTVNTPKTQGVGV